MRRITILATTVAALGVLALPSSSRACDDHQQQASAAQQVEIKTITVTELAKLIDTKAKVVILDANGEKTRDTYGVIPGAHRLAAYDTYDVAKELPADKDQPLVFYCGGPRCSAAPKAAGRARDAGHTNLSVLTDGIKGWVDAGKQVDKPTKQS